jgi:hypothetical protein
LSESNRIEPAEKREPVFLAANAREVDFVERLLVTEGVDFAVRPEAFLAETSAPCFEGALIEVPSGQAASCRRLLAEAGLSRGVVESDL